MLDYFASTGPFNMFENFKHEKIQTTDPEVVINLRYGGEGPPLLLLHGNPLTHVHWHLVAPHLSQYYTLVIPDLRGYGDSSKPPGTKDHKNYSFRRMAQDQVEVMSYLGFDEFFIAGHDRGARVAHRMALDHPRAVQKLATFDILPTHYVLNNTSWQSALNSYHWFFMAQPYDIPEKLIKGQENYYILKKLTKMGIGKGGFTDAALAEYARCCTPENIHAVCEDYRAGVGVDMEMDIADFEAGKKVSCPTAIYWGALSHTEKFFEPHIAWPQYCSNIQKMKKLECGHYPAEQVPDEVCNELKAFFGPS